MNGVSTYPGVSKSGASSNQLVEPLVRAVSSLSEPGELRLVAVTGDIAFSGTKEQYGIAWKTFDSLKSAFDVAGNSVQAFAFIPGNHDCDFTRDSAARIAVLKSVRNTSTWDDSIPAICASIQSEFREFADAFNCSLRLHPEKLISSMRLRVGEQAISLWGINTAWMSQLHEQPGSIWFPVHMLQAQIEAAEPALNVLLLHHPFAWLQTEVRREFVRLIDSSFTVVLGGHEHLAESWGRDDLTGHQALIVEGGVFQEQAERLEGSSFNVVTIDVTQSTLDVHPFEFDGKRYVPGAKRSTNFDKTRNSIRPYRQLSEKCMSFLRSAGATFRHPSKTTGLELFDIYVEPDLLDMDVARDTKNAEKLVSTKEVLGQVSSEPHVVVGGAEKAGKTAWLRWVYLQLHNRGLTPVRLEGASVRNPDPKALNKLIEQEYRQQYAVEDAVEWEQLDFGLKALLIDDFDSSRLNTEARKEVLSFLTMKFGCVFIACDDALLMQASGANSEFDGFRKYELPEFGHRLRDALIGKWLSIGRQLTLDRAAFQLQREQRARAINSLIGQSFIPSRPIFLLTLLQSMDMGAEATIRGSSLGEYYEYLIRHAVMGADVKPQDLDAVLNYLTELGYCLVEKQFSFLEAAELSAFDSNFSERYDLKLNFDSLHSQLFEADILEEWNGQYRFKYRYVLLFFGARYLARHFGRISEVTRQVNAVARNIATSKYADLMLFIVHHSNDPSVLDIVLEQANKVFASLVPMRLDQSDVEAINSLVLEIPRLALSDESAEVRREKTLRQRDVSANRRRHVGSDISDLSLSSLQDNSTNEALDFVQKMSYGLRLMGILGQVLRNYYGSLVSDRKELIATTSYAMLGRMLRSYFDLILEERDGLSDYIAQQLSERGAHTPERARGLANRFVFGLASLFTFVLVKRTSEFLGSDKLLPTHEKVADKVDTPLSRLLGLSVALDYPATGSSGAPRLIPIGPIENLYREFSNNPAAAFVLRRLMRDYLYMFEVSYKDKHRICEVLGISIQTQQQIQLTSKRKRGV